MVHWTAAPAQPTPPTRVAPWQQAKDEAVRVAHPAYARGALPKCSRSRAADSASRMPA
ncbi:hypothetical protein SAMN05216298_2675 [Glycomyces sambucus]|uniref:Uncharacterized protein n=1 Tax=Glycomyces sambucus TaxID=380244 RepID=A0A1G9H7U3_9ACTN|nr:hypothetical protein SAMN05216298_2675 [Glycomyces sambucus]